MQKKLNNKNIVKKSGGEKVFHFILYLLSGVILLIVVYPLWFVVIASFSDPSAVASGKVWLWPQGFTLDGYRELLRHDEIWIGYWNTILYTIVGTLIGVAVNGRAAFASSRNVVVGRRFISRRFSFTLFFNGGLVPPFRTIKDFHLYNTFWVMVLPFSVSVYNIIVARTFFENSIPSDLNDAAKIDGCGNLRYFFSIVMPLSKAVLAVIGLWTAVGMWNSYFNALVYLKDADRYPLQLVLRNILITNNLQMTFGSGEAMQIALRLSNLMRYSVIIVSMIGAVKG